jgi:hypothetical protein
MNHNSFFESKCGIMNHITDVVMLKYRSDGQDKYGVVKIHMGLNLEDKDLEYKGIEYSDYELREYLENNQSILTRIHSIRTGN